MKLLNKDIFSPISVALIIANLIALNMWSSNLFGRIDLTESKVYTLSDVTKNILRNLEEPLTIKAYFTSDLPAPYNSIARYVKDQLSEMDAYGGNNFRFEFLDPTDEEDLKAEAERFRLEPIQVNEMRADKVEFRLAYLGMVLLYEDRQEVIPAIQSLQNLEYDIVSKIRRVISSESSTIGFLEGHEEFQLRQEMTMLDRELRKLYELKPVNLTARHSIPDDINLLCIIGPKQNIPEEDRFAIDQFLMKGGKVLFALNKVNADLQNMSANRSGLRIDKWTEHYGFRVNDELVMDRKAPTLPFQTMTRFGRQITLVVYPLFPEVVNFNQDNIAMSILRQVRLYFPSGIDTSFAEGMENITLTPLLWSSNKSTIQSDPYNINPMTLKGQFNFDRANIPLGILLQGQFESFWKGKEIPKDDEDNPVSEDEIIPESPETRIVVIGDANFVQDQFLVQGLDNLTMMLNLIDWLAQDEALIKIRSREVSSRPIKDVSDATRRTVKYANLFLPPILVIGFGLLRWRMRKSSRKSIMAGYGLKSSGGDQS